MGYILFVGIKALKPREVNVYKLFIIPTVLIASRYQMFVSDNVLFYVLGLSVGAAVVWVLTSRQSVDVLPQSIKVKLPGSYQTLVLLLSFFLLKYAYGFLSSTQHSIALEYGCVEFFLIAMVCGYFLGRASSYMYRLKYYTQ